MQFYRLWDFAIETNTLKLPTPRPLPLLGNEVFNTEEHIRLPFVVVINDVFKLGKYCIRPYGRKTRSMTNVHFTVACQTNED